MSDMGGLPSLPYGGFVLDAFPSNLVLAYSTRKLRSTYVGPSMALRAPNSGNGILTDVGFDHLGLTDRQAVFGNVAPLGQTISLQTWYDQGPFARHAVQATLANQFAYSAMGFEAVSDGILTFLQSPAVPTGVQAYTVYMGVSVMSQDTTTTRIMLDFSTDSGAVDGFLVDFETISSVRSLRLYSANGGNLAACNYANPQLAEKLCFRFDRSQSTSNGQCVFFIESTKQTPTGNVNETATRPSANYGAFTFNMAYRPNATHLFGKQNMRWLLVYAEAHSDSTVDAIQKMLG